MVTIDGVTFHNVEETAKLLGLTTRTLQRWSSEEDHSKPRHFAKLRFVATPNGKRLYRQENILKVVSECLGMELSEQSLQDLPNLAKA